jgi:hypothetical protein
MMRVNDLIHEFREANSLEACEAFMTKLNKIDTKLPAKNANVFLKVALDAMNKSKETEHFTAFRFRANVVIWITTNQQPEMVAEIIKDVEEEEEKINYLRLKAYCEKYEVSELKVKEMIEKNIITGDDLGTYGEVVLIRDKVF